MLSLEKRIELLERLGKYMLSEDEEWKNVQIMAAYANAWFTEENITYAVNNIVSELLQKHQLEKWISQYNLPDEPKTVGIVMAGNIPLVGFHDFLCGFISGHKLMLKLSSKDEVLLKHLISRLKEWEPAVNEQVQTSDLLKGCDAYIATGSNNTARYFEEYFSKYPNIIRKNRTSVAVLDGTETDEELHRIAHDVFIYFGLGCRNVTQIYVPEGYNFQGMLDVFSSYDDIVTHSKYKNNYDYYLAIYLLNNVPYLTNGSLLLVENEIPFSAVSVLHYRFYDNLAELMDKLRKNNDIQCISGKGALPFGEAQKPGLNDYADGVDTMEFLTAL